MKKVIIILAAVFFTLNAISQRKMKAEVPIAWTTNFQDSTDLETKSYFNTVIQRYVLHASGRAEGGNFVFKNLESKHLFVNDSLTYNMILKGAKYYDMYITMYFPVGKLEDTISSALSPSSYQKIDASGNLVNKTYYDWLESGSFKLFNGNIYTMTVDENGKTFDSEQYKLLYEDGFRFTDEYVYTFLP